MISVLVCGSSSVCLEIVNREPYWGPEAYTVWLEDEKVLQGKANVFSLFGLAPDREYTVRVCFESGREESVSFETEPESWCVSVRDFGAVGDGVHEDTGAIQAAINCLPEDGRLYFPPGTYLTLPLALKSHITLDLAEGATLLGSPERERYPILKSVCVDPQTGREVPQTGFEGEERDSYQSLLHASYAEDIAIVGRGTIDGNAMKGDWWEDFASFPAARPRVVFFNRCRHVLLLGVKICNGPAWHIHPFYSRDVLIFDITVAAPVTGPNTDAIDPESCNGVQIVGCRFSVGDDCVAIKSGKIDMGRKYGRCADRHEIRNCLMHFGHGAVTLGSELAAGIRRLEVSQCLFEGTDRGVRIKTRRGRGEDSVLTGLVFENIRMVGVRTPVVINAWYNCCDADRHTEYVWSREKLPVDERTPSMGAFAFRNMVCTDAEVAACYIDGLPESPIEEVILENFRVSFAADARPGIPAMQNFARERCRLGLYLDNVEKIRIRHVELTGTEGKALQAEHYDDMITEGFEVD